MFSNVCQKKNQMNKMIADVMKTCKSRMDLM